ncbi:hypothetical protein ODE01S_00820 [Oceanithermus desulfurans NBRC 100063]|uniref:KAP NTPase domain-containing protein n=2 Tax=Oceanithermus desulfurans TaxID=227924 RepID=A0A511RG88_9DEIN|nr:hypothetical protein ODE01S_00820 [Oceanithermus desulfurans NBRC 100063]
MKLKIGNTPSITVPIFFNAWRYEKEEHLIYPLVKVLEINLRTLVAEAGKANRSEPESGSPSNGGAGRGRSWIIEGISRAWQSARRAVVAAGMGFAGLTSGVTIRGEIETPKSDAFKAISGLFVDGRLSIELSGKDIVDFLMAAKGTPESAREKGENGKGPAADDLGEERRDEDLLSFAERVRSDYYDFQRILRELTGRDGVSGQEGEEAKVNLLFLIDDLDRCLPEKAVEMLEAIKLFMEVEGAAFVLALDDEVVERGIVHRYRDYTALQHPTAWDSIAYSVSNERYREFLDLYTNQMGQPITGHEYLEKIVHLQVRLPRVEADDVGPYLTERYPRLFTRRLEVEAERVAEGDGLKARKGLGKAVAGGEETEPREQLIELFRDAVPPVPRKLIRAAELLDLKLRTAKKNGWDVLDSEKELYVLAQLTLVQLFAPELYRFAQREFPHFLGKMVEWLDSGQGAPSLPTSFCLEELERRYRAVLTEAKAARSSGDQPSGAGERKEAGNDGSGLCAQRPVANLAPRLVESKELPLLDHLIKARQKRSGFDPFNVVLKNPDGVYDGVRFGEFFLLRRRVAVPGGREERTEGEHVGRAGDAYTELVPRDVEMFVGQLTAPDAVYWRNALEDEGIAGKRGRLRGDVFSLIVQNLPDFGGDAAKILDWLETLEPVLGPDQLDELVRRLGVFVALGAGPGEEGEGEGGNP